MVHLERDLASAHARDFVTDLDELHQQLGQHIADAQCQYQTSTDSDNYRLWNSRLEAMFMSRLNSSIRHDLQRSYLINSLVRTKSLHSLAPILSLSDFQTVSELYTQSSTSQCWNQQFQIRFPIEFNPTPHNHC